VECLPRGRFRAEPRQPPRPPATGQGCPCPGVLVVPTRNPTAVAPAGRRSQGHRTRGSADPSAGGSHLPERGPNPARQVEMPATLNGGTNSGGSIRPIPFPWCPVVRLTVAPSLRDRDDSGTSLPVLSRRRPPDRRDRGGPDASCSNPMYPTHVNVPGQHPVQQ